MTAGFMLVTMEDVVLASRVKFLFVDAALLCIDLFQSMLMKIMFAPAVLCSSGPVPCSVEADVSTPTMLTTLRYWWSSW